MASLRGNLAKHGLHIVRAACIDVHIEIRYVWSKMTISRRSSLYVNGRNDFFAGY